MIPWNPIHRYAGRTSLFDSIDEQESRGRTLARLDGWGTAPKPSSSERAPLGFVDVRAEGAHGAGDSHEVAFGGAPVEELELPAAAPVDVSADAEVPAATEEKVPFYKREISFGRKKGAAEPGSDSWSQAEEAEADSDTQETDAATEIEEKVPTEIQEKVPFYKRELSLRRNSESPVAEESPDETAMESVPVDSEPEPEPAPQVAETEVEEYEPFAPVEDEVGQTADDEQPAFAAEDVESVPATPASDPVVELEPLLEPDASPELITRPVAKVPLHKRELSFGKSGKQTSSEKKTRSGRRTGRKIVGLKIGASQLAAAVVQESDGRYELLELARTPLEPGIVLDGEVRDADSLVSALRAFFADQKLPMRDVRIGVASNRIGVRTFEIAGIDDESRFDNAVRFKAHEVLPIAVSDSVLDYRVLDERLSETGEPIRRVLLVVAPRDQVAPYVDVAERAGLKLAGIDLEALGLLRAFVEPGVERMTGGTSTVVVSIGHEASTLLVSGGGACEFTRVFDRGGSTLQEAIAQELQVHPAEAATILRHLSLAGNSRRVEGIDDDARNRALEAVRLRLTPFARELVSSLQFYQTQPDSLGIGEIMITGGTSQLDGLGEALHQMIGVQVKLGDPLQRLTLRKGVESGFEQSIGSLAVPIGLAIDDDPMRTVDLTPRDIASKRRRPNLAPVLLPVAAAIPLAALGFFFTQAHGKVSHRSSQLSTLHSTLASLPQPRGPQIDTGIQSIEAARASSVAQVLASRTSWDAVFGDLSRVLPANVWLTELKAAVPTPLSTAPAATVTPTTTASSTSSTKSPAAPVAATGVTITGYTLTQPDVAMLLSRLVALPSLENVQLVSAAHAPLGQKDVIQFTILANLRGAGGGA
jgi:type IV pilus assembly protein PilM